MKIQHLFLLAACLASSFAIAQPAQQRIRGTITGLDGDTLSFKSREGQEMKVTLAPNVSIGAAKKIALADIKPGSFVGTSAVKGKDGMLTLDAVAKTFRYLDPEEVIAQRKAAADKKKAAKKS